MANKAYENLTMKAGVSIRKHKTKDNLQISFEFKGKIDHSDGGSPSEADYWRGNNYYDNTVKRSLYIDDILYTFSNKYLIMSEIEDLEEVKKLELKKEKEGEGTDYEVVN